VIVVADASPLRYLILIEHTHTLQALSGRLLVPPIVITAELSHEQASRLAAPELFVAPLTRPARSRWDGIYRSGRDGFDFRSVSRTNTNSSAS
jgi:hypothetical protein